MANHPLLATGVNEWRKMVYAQNRYYIKHAIMVFLVPRNAPMTATAKNKFIFLSLLQLSAVSLI